MNAKTPHEWSAPALMAKAQRYADLMLDQPREDWKFGFWSSLCLEMLIRAALAHTSPVLLAEPKDWTNIAHALGLRPAGAKAPKSIGVIDAANRISALYAEFSRDDVNFCTIHLQWRNAELHTGELAFDSQGTAWLPHFYVCCDKLLGLAGSSLGELFGAHEAAVAETLIQAMQDETAKSVQGVIAKHKQAWLALADTERQKLFTRAATLAERSVGHRVVCPACQSASLTVGVAAGPGIVQMEDNVIVTRTPMLPIHFECKACGLKINGLSKLNACGLGDTYTSASYEDPVTYFAVEPEIRYMEADMEDDNNEP
ncbi:hypothetical protein [Pelomonas cellulosilytica]|uniref:Uncharacterized protein n=1 Tax=Pelomonas cellulosilytica TaxID=2906762 RepID=A0ABS8XYC5_9BURK|nr:hypothetical protein [Pelomonas sp. P8]MCE4556270.1 hypothetical protein [Pelomonas sp. P8]